MAFVTFNVRAWLDSLSLKLMFLFDIYTHTYHSSKHLRTLNVVLIWKIIIDNCLWLELVTTYFTNILEHNFLVGVVKFLLYYWIVWMWKTIHGVFFNCFILIPWNSFCSKTLIYKYSFDQELIYQKKLKTFNAVNARCIFSDFRIQRDAWSWFNRQAYNFSHRVG